MPYVGAGVAASAAAMDKELMKALFAEAGLPQVEHRVLARPRRRRRGRGSLAELGLPLFVKPANLGSSVAVSKVKTREAARGARSSSPSRYDRKAIVERGLDVREVEVSVLGNDASRGLACPARSCPTASSTTTTRSTRPTAAPSSTSPRACRPRDERRGARARARAPSARSTPRGYARVDFFLERGYGPACCVNEINTIPGFTSISMYPKLWEASGLAYPELLARLVALGLERHAARERLVTRYGG